jgi:hypothetical protein
VEKRGIMLGLAASVDPLPECMAPFVHARLVCDVCYDETVPGKVIWVCVNKAENTHGRCGSCHDRVDEITRAQCTSCRTETMLPFISA